MRITDVIRIINGTPNHAFNDFCINSIKTDSRDIKKGDIFLIINAGYLYIDIAIANGALGVIVEQEITREDILIIKVTSTKEALKKFASFFRNQYSKPVIAITGSVGKTTTKELIGGVLASTRKVLKNEGNKNNIIGICNTLLKLDNSYECVVLEVGMNHLLEIHEISLIVKPTICLITSIGSSHLGNLKSKRNILKAKMEIIDGNKYALLILNGEDNFLKKIKGMKCYRNEFPYTAFFKHLQMNYIFAIQVCLFMGMSYDAITAQLDKLPLYNQRMNIIYRGNRIIIDDSYNASYESILGGLKYIQNLKGRKVIILGEILELGRHSKKIHRKLIKPLKKIKNCVYFFVGGAFNTIPFGNHFQNTNELIHFISDYSFLLDDVIYIKASHAWGFEKVVKLFQKEFIF